MASSNAAAGALPRPARARLRRLFRLIQPQISRAEAEFRRRIARRYDARAAKALLAMTTGAAARASSFPAFFEQVEYSSRRLAKLNLPADDVLQTLASYDEALPAGLEPLQAAVAILVHRSYYGVRAAEADAFYALYRAQLEANGLEDLLSRFAAVLAAALRAETGRIRLCNAPRELARQRYIKSGSAGERLVSAELRGRYRSYWSIPMLQEGRLAGVMQFGFRDEYGWLPRELELLAAAGERCLAAVEKERLLDELAAREAEVRRLAGRMIEAEQAERRRISRELHDDAAQSLLFIRLQLEAMEAYAPGALRDRIQEIRGVCENTIVEVRRILAALNPAALDQLGLAAAIRQVAARFRKICPARLSVQMPSRLDVPSEAAAVAYRAVQECLQNAARHAQATRVKLSVRSTDKWLELQIEDDGVGFDVAAAVRSAKSYGLSGMMERVELFGGALHVFSAPGKGTRIRIRLPLHHGRSVADGEDSNSPHRRSHSVPARHPDAAVGGGGHGSRRGGGKRE